MTKLDGVPITSLQVSNLFLSSRHHPWLFPRHSGHKEGGMSREGHHERVLLLRRLLQQRHQEHWLHLRHPRPPPHCILVVLGQVDSGKHFLQIVYDDTRVWRKKILLLYDVKCFKAYLIFRCRDLIPFLVQILVFLLYYTDADILSINFVWQSILRLKSFNMDLLREVSKNMESS